MNGICMWWKELFQWPANDDILTYELEKIIAEMGSRSSDI